jgi:putative membrane protein
MMKAMADERQMEKRRRLATGIALAFHISGLIAIGIFQSALFIRLTPLNLLVSAALVFYTQAWPMRNFMVFAALAFLLGFASEYIGVNTGYLFGNYSYGEILGPQWKGVPLIIGLQWLVTMYCIGVSMHLLHERLKRNAGQSYQRFPGWLMAFSLVSDGAVLAVVFDWVLEPVAVRLGYWQWAGGEIPLLNYLSWYGVSVIILFIFHKLPFPRRNLFAVHLLMIQFMFFLLLRTIFRFGL